MKKLFFIILFLIPFFSFSQECKFFKDEKDDFTGARKVMTKPFRVTSGIWEKMMISLRTIDNDVLFSVAYTPVGSATLVRKDDNLLIKLKSGKVITLSSIQNVFSDTHYAAGVTVLDITVEYEITKSDLQELLNSEVEKVRMYTSKDYFEVDISGKGAKLLQDNIRCILEVIGK